MSLKQYSIIFFLFCATIATFLFVFFFSEDNSGVSNESVANEESEESVEITGEPIRTGSINVGVNREEVVNDQRGDYVEPKNEVLVDNKKQDDAETIVVPDFVALEVPVNNPAVVTSRG